MDYALASFDDPDMTSGEFGVPLTREEAADVNRRASLNLDDLIAYGAESGTDFGGLWVDQSANALIHIQLLDGVNEAPWLALVPNGFDAVVDRVANSAQQLDDAMAQLSEAIQSGDVSINLAYVAVQDNGILASAPAGTYDEDAIRSQFGPVTVSDGPHDVIDFESCPVSDCLNPYQARIGVTAHISGTDYVQCSSAAMFEANVVNSSTAFDVMMTAGHCADTAETNAVWYHQRTGPWAALGAQVDYEIVFGGCCDVAYIKLYNSSGAGPATDNLYTPGLTRHMTDTRPITSDFVGEGVCKTGIGTNYTCGAVTALNVTADAGGGHVMTQFLAANYQHDLGDSGGATFLSTTYYGIHSGDLITGPLAGNAVYTQVRRARNAYDGNGVDNVRHFCVLSNQC